MWKYIKDKGKGWAVGHEGPSGITHLQLFVRWPDTRRCCNIMDTQPVNHMVDMFTSKLSSRLGVLETSVLVSGRLEIRFYKSWSQSRSWNLRVLVSVLVLEPSSLGLGFGTWDSGDSVIITLEAWNWDKIEIIG